MCKSIEVQIQWMNERMNVRSELAGSQKGQNLSLFSCVYVGILKITIAK